MRHWSRIGLVSLLILLVVSWVLVEPAALQAQVEGDALPEGAQSAVALNVDGEEVQSPVGDGMLLSVTPVFEKEYTYMNTNAPVLNPALEAAVPAETRNDRYVVLNSRAVRSQGGLSALGGGLS